LAIYSLTHRPITRTGKCAQTQPHTSAAHCAYITREEAATEVLAEHIPTDPAEACRWFIRMEDNDPRKNARLIEKITLALPRELSHQQNAALVKDYCRAMSNGRAPWIAAIHDGPMDADNPHAHLIFRDRDIGTGKTVMKASDFKSTTRFRELWERKANEHLKRAGVAARIDRRTLKAQGIDREAGIHVGPRGMAVERKGLTPSSRIIEVRRFNEGSAGPIWLDYSHIDRGRTRAQENTARRQRNAMRSETLAPWKSLFIAAQEIALRQRGPPRDVVGR
jgi:hypothetical protein